MSEHALPLDPLGAAPDTPNDLAIAEATRLLPIGLIARGLGLDAEDVEPYGHFKGKIADEVWDRVSDRPDGRLVLVTAVSPTPAGEGKTTVTIGLGQALCRLGHRAVVAVREPSLGPVFGVKGGATGGGHAQVLPMVDINLHFTGDFHAVTAANNLLAAAIDNHLHHGNGLELDPRRITFSRVLDVNDRALRQVVVGLGGAAGGVPREESFMITPASEVMAVLCLATDAEDLARRLGNIIVGYNRADEPVRARDLGVQGAMAALLRDALKPNLVQTTEHTPALVHGGPFANIAHGCNTVRATRLALKLGDWVVTEAGFGADLGAEKFIDIKCRAAGIQPDVVVLVATIRSLKMQGGKPRSDLRKEDLDALAAGATNLRRHFRNVTRVYGLPCVVALNLFESDTEAEVDWLEGFVDSLGGKLVRTDVHGLGGAGGEALAEAVCVAASKPNDFSFVYDDEDPPLRKLEKIARRVYGADGVVLSRQAERDLERLARQGFELAPVCIAKTPYSFTHDPTQLGAPSGWSLYVREVRGAGGAGFLIALTGEVMTMPGLPASPAAERIAVGPDGRISGLF